HCMTLLVLKRGDNPMSARLIRKDLERLKIGVHGIATVKRALKRLIDGKMVVSSRKGYELIPSLSATMTDGGAGGRSRPEGGGRVGGGGGGGGVGGRLGSLHRHSHSSRDNGGRGGGGRGGPVVGPARRGGAGDGGAVRVAAHAQPLLPTGGGGRPGSAPEARR